MNTLKVGLIQHRAIANNIDENLKLGLKYIDEAKKLGADIVLFPEMWSNGYEPPFSDAFDNPFNGNYEEERRKWIAEAIDEESNYIKSFRNIAKSLEIGIVITYLSKGSSNPQNTALVIDKTGDILMKYSKVHTCDFSLEALLEGGTDFKVCEFSGVKIGVMICYDREFPESARVLMLEGAEIILVPNACDMNPARTNQLSTRAFENMVGVAMTNYPKEKWGNSCAYSPIVFDEYGNYIDNKIVSAGDIEENILIAQFNLDDIRNYRKSETLGNAYRKVESYKKLLDKIVKDPFIRGFSEIESMKNWKLIKQIDKGWSKDKKFYIKTKDNEELLLRISDISEYAKKKRDFELIKDVSSNDILMSVPIEFGVCNNGKEVYSLFTWICGEDANIKLLTLSKEEQYNLGVKAGLYLKKIHNIQVTDIDIDWYTRFNKKIDNKISMYKHCGILVDGSEQIISYLENNRHLLKNRPQCFQHGDYHIGNMIITPLNELGIIDFNRCDIGDPFEEFNRITWCAEVSPEFASGYINGYFNNEVPDLFFRLMLLYISSNQLGSIAWAKSFGKEEIDTMVEQTKKMLKWYDGFKKYIPSWYIKFD